MTILHGTWIENTSEKHFFIWGETWRSLSSDISSDDSILMYPFSVDKQGIVEQLNSNKIKIEKNKNIESVSQIFYLPSKFHVCIVILYLSSKLVVVYECYVSLAKIFLSSHLVIV